MREAEARVGGGERPERDRQPQQAVPEQRALEREQPRALLDRRPAQRQVGQDGHHAHRIEQLGQRRLPLRHQDEAEHVGQEEQQHAAAMARHAAAAADRERELDRRGDDGVGQRDVAERREVRGRPEGPEERGIHAGRVRREQDAQRHREQEQHVERERGEEAPSEVLGAADGGGVDEGVHARRHVARRRLARHGRGHQQPDQAAHHHRLRHGERRVEREVVAQRLGERAVAGEDEGEDDEDGSDDPRPGAARLVGELEAEDPPQSHDVVTAGAGRSRRRPMCPAMALK
jgi:hypothetical protein